MVGGGDNYYTLNRYSGQKGSGTSIQQSDPGASSEDIKDSAVKKTNDYLIHKSFPRPQNPDGSEYR